MDRIKQATPATISNAWSSGGAPVDPGTVTIGVIAADGTVVVAPGTATAGGGAAARTFNLTAAHTAQLDTLTATWTTLGQGTDTTTHQIVGDFLFTIAQARAALGDPAYDEDRIQEARIYAEAELEKALGFALVPRYSRESFSAVWNRPIRLRPYVRAIRSVSVAGTPLSAGDLTALTYTSGGFLYGYWWPTGYGNVTVSYEHGLDAGNDLMPGAQRYALAAAVEYLGGGTGSIDPRAERLITDDGTIVYGSTSGGQFRAAGVNEWVAANRLPVVA